MRFDWQRFCAENKIPFVTAGPNTAKGNISIHCPFCGEADQSEHMGLSLNINRPDYGCWRNQAHRGRNPAYLITKLMGWTMGQAIDYVQNQGDNPDDYEAAINAMKTGEEAEREAPKPRDLVFPKEFRHFNFKTPHPMQGRFFNYLSTRGFGLSTHVLIRQYKLMWCVTGDYKQRIIIPVFHEKQLVSWTARAITGAEIRYMTLEKEKEVRNIKDCLLLHGDSVLDADRRVLVVCEGPFDAMKLDVLGRDLGVSATCVFGLTLQPAQLELLSKIGRQFKGVAVLLDNGETGNGAIMCSQLGEIMGREIMQASLPAGVKDPGDLTRQQIAALSNQLNPTWVKRK